MTFVERQTMKFDSPLSCEEGGMLPSFGIAFETYGKLSPSADNAILICHGLTADSHAAGWNSKNDLKPGWWDIAIGPGKTFDTSRHFVLCSNVIGGCGGSTGPSSVNPPKNSRYAMDFPVVTIGDMVEAQSRLAMALGIKRFLCVAGGCMGGYQAIEWMRAYPEMMDKAIVIGAAPKASPYRIALWEIMRMAISLDPAFNNGDYYGASSPSAGIGLATAFGLILRMSPDALEYKFGLRKLPGRESASPLEPRFEVEDFIRSAAKKAGGSFDANSLIFLTRAMDLFDVSRGFDSIGKAISGYKGGALLINYKTDWRYPPEENEVFRSALAENGSNVHCHIAESKLGHGAFVHEFGEIAPVIAKFLSHS